MCVLVPIGLLFRVPLRAFIAAVKEPAILAFTTTPSESALPPAMERLEELGVPRKIIAFILPLGCPGFAHQQTSTNATVLERVKAWYTKHEVLRSN